PCPQEDSGARPFELRQSKCGDGSPCNFAGHKKCCAEADDALHQAACMLSDRCAGKNPNSDPDYSQTSAV
ncbi:hypothetical protein BGX28_001285, partial [Mortierella sp. GBA30]